MACRGAAVALFLVGALLVAHIAAQNCYEPCSTDDDCLDLVCLNGECNDSPDATTPICTEAPPPPALSPPSAPPPEGATCPPPPVPPPEGATCESQSINSPSIPGCNQDTGAVCCIEGCLYTTYTCSPPVYAETEAILTLNDFKEGGDGGGAGACYDVCGCTKMWYDDPSDRVVALSTGWYNNGALCGMIISIAANGKRTTATVVDECDSLRGCDEGHDYQPPCRINIVDASAAVWGDLGVESSMQGGDLPITWSRLDS